LLRSCHSDPQAGQEEACAASEGLTPPAHTPPWGQERPSGGA
jgi:hypothetical protein